LEINLPERTTDNTDFTDKRKAKQLVRQKLKITAFLVAGVAAASPPSLPFTNPHPL
jgi:hypothetical protein